MGIMKNEFNILVTDSRVKHALAAVRNLGGRGLSIAIASDAFSPTRFSRYSKKSFEYDDFVIDLLQILKENNIDVVLPAGYHSNIACSKNKKEISKYSNILISDYKKIKIVSDKSSLYNFLKKNKIPSPKTYILKKDSDIKRVDINGAMIIKSSEELKGKKIEYIKNKTELIEIFKKRRIFGKQIVQERINGFGCGYFALCKGGEILANFQHKRIRQYPESGGISSFSQSFYDKRIEKIGEKIIKKLGWDGLIMIEFIFDEEKKGYKVIEINPKLWGSLDLAIASGIEFPYLYYLAAKGIKFAVPKYKEGVKFQWVLPEDTIRIKTSKNKVTATKEYLVSLFDFKTRKDLGYIFKDPIPTIIRIGGTIVDIFK